MLHAQLHIYIHVYGYALGEVSFQVLDKYMWNLKSNNNSIPMHDVNYVASASEREGQAICGLV